MEKQLTLLGASIENFKNIEKKIIEFDGDRSYVFFGGNGAGKSSVLQAILSPLNSKELPSKPIREGQERGKISVTLGQDKQVEYIIDMHFTPGQQRGRLVITTADGTVIKQKSVLDSIIGDISFDITEFLKGSTKKDTERRIQVLKKLTGREKELDLLEIERKEKYDLRQKLGTTIDVVESQLKNHGYTQEDLEKYAEPSDVVKIEKEIADAEKDNEEWNNGDKALMSINSLINERLSQKSQNKSTIDAKIKQIEKLKAEIEILEKEKKQAEERISGIDFCITEETVKRDKIVKWLDENPKIDTSALSKKLSDASTHNFHHQRIQEYSEKQKALQSDKRKYDEYTKEIKDLENKKQDVIKTSNLPVEGLTFTDEDIFLNGLPFEVGQINTQKILETGEEVAMALNPNLKVIFVSEGSLYDIPNLERLIKKAEERKYMVLAEVVNPAGGSEVVIKFAEEYISEMKEKFNIES